MLDPRGMVTKIRAVDDDEGAQGPAEAPATIKLGEAIEPGQKETFGYRPDLGEVPLISLPDTLPDLLGNYITCRTTFKVELVPLYLERKQVLASEANCLTLKASYELSCRQKPWTESYPDLIRKVGSANRF